MKKLIHTSYPAEINVIILFSLFLISCFFSYELFDVRFHNPDHLKNAALGMVLVGVATVLMVLILWEEILFKAKAKEISGGLVFRNRRKKLKAQILLFSGIPVIFTFIYLEYDLNLLHFVIWSAVCMVIPAIEIIVSGINNHKSYLTLTNRMIKYKNNNREGSFETRVVRNITIIKDDKSFVKKIQVLFTNNHHLIIDLDEMHLNAFCDPIHKFIKANYKDLLKETAPVTITR
jgi:hypothetical protein